MQTGHTKHLHIVLIPKVYDVCGYTVTAEDTMQTLQRKLEWAKLDTQVILQGRSTQIRVAWNGDIALTELV